MGNFFFIFLCLFHLFSFAKECNVDDLSSSMQLTRDSIVLESKRIQTATENIANADVAIDLEDRNAFVRKVVFVKKKKGRFFVVIGKDKKSKLRKVYIPNHPYADKEGYVFFPGVDKDIEQADFLDAKRKYELNLEVLKISEGIRRKTLDMIK